MLKIQIFTILDSGETEEINTDQKIADILNSTECYLIFDEDAKIIWLWKGKKARIRSKFIAAKKSQELRGQVGLMNKVISIDEGDEPDSFLKSIGAPPRAGRVVAKEIKVEELNQPAAPPSFSTANSSPEPQPVSHSATAPTSSASYSAPSQSQQSISSPAPQVASVSVAPATQPSQAPPQGAIAPMTDQNVERVLGILKNLKVPEGYQREMVIIGNSAYSISVKEQTFLGKKKVEKTLEPIGSLPEGVFFADGYAPRVLVENGIVLAIEFLKKEASEYTNEKVQKTSLKEHLKTKDLVSSLGFKIKKE
ncbi:MAG: hypothetical protein ACTSYS_08795 [Promethearchaeota archaeon]